MATTPAYSGTPWHGADPGTRRFVARPGRENLGTARHGQYWHGNILARHGTNGLDASGKTFMFFGGNIFWDFEGDVFWISGQYIFGFTENVSLSIGIFFPKVMRLKNGAEPYTQNILGPSFQKHILFQLKDLGHLL